MCSPKRTSILIYFPLRNYATKREKKILQQKPVHRLNAPKQYFTDERRKKNLVIK